MSSMDYGISIAQPPILGEKLHVQHCLVLAGCIDKHQTAATLRLSCWQKLGDPWNIAVVCVLINQK